MNTAASKAACESEYARCSNAPIANGLCRDLVKKACCAAFDDLSMCAWYNQDWFMYTCIGVGALLLILCIVIIACCCCCGKKGGRGGGGKDLKIGEESTETESA